MTSGRKKILFQTDFSLAKTGFGRTAKAILTFLHGLGKYEIVHLCCGEEDNSPNLQKTPWKSIGTVPSDPSKKRQLAKDEQNSKKAFYGVFTVDKVVKEERPDIYIGMQDIWGLAHAIEKPWFNKITSVAWTTLDSLPILPVAIVFAANSLLVRAFSAIFTAVTALSAIKVLVIALSEGKVSPGLLPK